MTQLKAHMTIGAPFSNAEEIVRVRYNFADDGGATGAKNIITADGPVVITGYWVIAKTGVTSDGAATLSVGPTGAATKFLSSVAKTTLDVEGELLTVDAYNDVPHYLANGQSLIQTINTAALTGGVLEHVIKYARA